MVEFRWITPDFAVAAQLAPSDLARAGAEGFKALVNNRPEGEEAGQPKGAEIRAAADAANIAYQAIPFAGPPPPGVVAAMAELLEQAPGPVLAYCRTGTRSIMAWAMAQSLSGTKPPNEIIALAAKAGYDLSGARGAIEALAPRT